MVTETKETSRNMKSKNNKLGTIPIRTKDAQLTTNLLR